jgi:hypothetical protein
VPHQIKVFWDWPDNTINRKNNNVKLLLIAVIFRLKIPVFSTWGIQILMTKEILLSLHDLPEILPVFPFRWSYVYKSCLIKGGLISTLIVFLKILIVIRAK